MTSDSTAPKAAAGANPAPKADATAAPARPDLFADYRLTPGIADELFTPDGQMRPVWRRFVNRFRRLGETEITARFERGDQYLRDAGVFFRQYSTDPLQERAWPLSHVPVILHEEEWSGICDGLAERADLLERVMADLYGDGRLVAENHLPASLIAGSRQWLRPMVGVRPRGGHYLHYLAFEIGRSPDGSWFVLGDRTQAPSGAGFALENRMATGRIFPERFPRDHIHKLAGFLSAFREQIEDLAGLDGTPGQPALLTPGPSNEAYYEHTYIARYLGMLLLEGEDLLVEDGRAMVRTIRGPMPLGALWRRIDASFADPLELNEHSRIGTPGLVQALRAGNLSMVNAMGSGVLEMRAMLAFLPRIAEVLTGRPLRLPNIATWWCGGAQARDYVRENAERMMIGSAYAVDLPFDLDATTALGGAFRSGAQGSIADWLAAEGATLVGQEAVTLSTTPAWDTSGPEGGRLVPRPMTVRVFAARTRAGWQFLPGGYARIGRSEDATALAMQRGGSVADVWVVADRPLPPDSRPRTRHQRTRRPEDSILPARAADNLYWMGRYIERSEDALRLFRSYHLRLATTKNPADPRLRALNAYLKSYGHDLSKPVPDSLIGRIRSARGCAAKVRDRFSTDGWNALDDLLRTSTRMANTAEAGDDAARAMTILLRKMTGFAGLVHENMYRFSGWHFLSFGRALERADTLASILVEFAGPDVPQGSLDLAVELADSVITHQRRYRVETSLDTVLDLLVLDEANPRGLVFLLRRMHELAQALPGAQVHGRPSELVRVLMRLDTEFTCAEPEQITAERLIRLRGEFATISDLLTRSYLR